VGRDLPPAEEVHPMGAELSSKWEDHESGSGDPKQAGRDSLARPHTGADLGSLSNLYAERVEELEDLRRRLDEIGFIVSSYLNDLDTDAGPSALDDLKRILELTQYDYDR